MKVQYKRNSMSVFFVVVTCLLSTNLWGQSITKRDRERAISMLDQISPDVEKHYYDPKLHGVNWDAKVEEAKQKINAADSMGRAIGQIAVVLGSLHDSHTYFSPPAYSSHYDYGWQAEMIGDHCFIIHVRPGSDAEKKGVKVGDELLALNGFTPDRDNFRNIQYVFHLLRPQFELNLSLRSPAGQERGVNVVSTVTAQKRILDLTTGDNNDIWDLIRQEENSDDLERAQFVGIGDEVGVAKLPSFMVGNDTVDFLLGKARKHKALVLDLRGDPGGRVETLKYLVGRCFENEVKIGDRVGRSERKPMLVKTHYQPFTGKIVVLVDSRSASAAELFARVIQIEKRGTVIGDRSSGSVMEARRYTYKVGVDTIIPFSASITDADIIMTDGKSLENNGVVPDELALPTAEDMAGGRDPVLAHAIELAGGKLTPEAAGKLFPYKWPQL